MMDQAYKLRDLVRQRAGEAEAASERTARPPKITMNARMITIASGKGGVGKSNFAVNLAIHLRKENKRVIIIDADFGLANVEVLYGIIPKYNAGNVLAGQVSMENALTMGPLGILFLSGGSGLTALSDITEAQMNILIDGFAQLDELADIILIDTGAGVSKSVINCIRATRETIVVTTPDPTSVTDSYALIKTIKESAADLPVFKLLVNRVEDPNEGDEVFEKLSSVSERFLGVTLNSLGSIPYDVFLGRSVKKQSPVSILYPNAESAVSIEAICRQLLDMPPIEKKVGIRSFLMNLIGRKG